MPKLVLTEYHEAFPCWTDFTTQGLFSGWGWGCLEFPKDAQLLSSEMPMSAVRTNLCLPVGFFIFEVFIGRLALGVGMMIDK